MEGKVYRIALKRTRRPPSLFFGPLLPYFPIVKLPSLIPFSPNSYDLVIVDSMASVVRKEFHAGRTSSRVARAKLLATQAKTLKELAEHHRIPILVTNQITTHYEGEEKEKDRT